MAYHPQETDEEAAAAASAKKRDLAVGRIRLGILLSLQLVMSVELVLLLREGLWGGSAWFIAITDDDGAASAPGRR